MRIAFLALITLFSVSGSALSAESKKGFEIASINIGYMSQDELGARIAVADLTDYIKKLEPTCSEVCADARTPENLDIVIAVRADQKSHIWLVSSLASPDATGLHDQLRTKLEAVTPPKLSSGPIAFAIQGQIAGGMARAPQQSGSASGEKIYTPDGAAPKPNSDIQTALPVPTEWKEALAQHGRSLKFDDLLSLVWPVSAPAPDAEGFMVPEGIRYHKTSDDQNQNAKQLLTAKFFANATDADVLALFEKRLICGPGLWAEMKNNPAFTPLTKGTITFNEGSVKLEGKLFQSPEEILLFWKAFKQRTDFTGLKIRKLNPDELKTFWAMISFDIEEPIFILDSPKHKILVSFTHDGKILWIDDYQNFPAHS